MHRVLLHVRSAGAPDGPGVQSFQALDAHLILGFRAVDAVKLAKHELESQTGPDPWAAPNEIGIFGIKAARGLW